MQTEPHEHLSLSNVLHNSLRLAAVAETHNWSDGELVEHVMVPYGRVHLWNYKHWEAITDRNEK